MPNELWIPPDARVLPTERKSDGGSYFDDEMVSEEQHKAEFNAMVVELIRHINTRPDHVVFVASSDERHQMRTVFNSWREGGIIGRIPTIKIDYGVRDGTIRVDEDRT